MKHTPGPWKVNTPSGLSTAVWSADGQHFICRTNMPIKVSHVQTPEVQDANARLMAFAPELRAALERLADRVEAIELPDGSTPDTLEARALLAKIDGDDEAEP